MIIAILPGFVYFENSCARYDITWSPSSPSYVPRYNKSGDNMRTDNTQGPSVRRILITVFIMAIIMKSCPSRIDYQQFAPYIT